MYTKDINELGTNLPGRTTLRYAVKRFGLPIASCLRVHISLPRSFYPL